MAINSELFEDIQKYKNSLSDEIVKENCYMTNKTLYNVRTLFRFRSKTYEAKLKYKNKPEYKKDGYLCKSHESQVDQNVHVLYCPEYSDLRVGKDIQNNTHLAQYLQNVLKTRMY